MSLTLVHVTGTFKTPEGDPAGGTVTAALVAPMKNGTTEVAPTPILAVVVEGALEAKGGGSFELYATDDTGTTPEGVHYLFTVQLDSAPVRQFYAKLPHATSPVDLSALEP